MSHVIWVLSGRLTFVEGDVTHDLAPGDSLEFGPPADCTYRNDGDTACRYLVVLVRRYACSPDEASSAFTCVFGALWRNPGRLVPHFASRSHAGYRGVAR